MKIIYPGHQEYRFGIFGCQILCITDLAIMPLYTLLGKVRTLIEWAQKQSVEVMGDWVIIVRQ